MTASQQLPRLDYTPPPADKYEHWDSYAVSNVVDVLGPLKRVQLPVTTPPLQQHGEGACTTFAGAHARNTLALSSADVGRVGLLTEDDARAAYARAQDLDDRPGRAYVGTSVLAAMLAGREAGWWPGFLWAHGTRQIAATLDQLQQPVIVGVPWLDGMWSTDSEGRVQVQGRFIGGHALELFGFDPAHPLHDGQPGFDWLNSQDGYGINGVGSISARDLSWLLANRGEAAVPMRAKP